MGHVLDFDDTLDTGGSVHPGVSVLGSVLATCDSLSDVTGRDVLLAVENATNFPISMDNAGTLFLIPGEKPMPPVTLRFVTRGPVKSKRARSHQSTDLERLRRLNYSVRGTPLKRTRCWRKPDSHHRFRERRLASSNIGSRSRRLFRVQGVKQVI